ncbi:hypothetical protein I8H83_05090 [Candidatus Saccharibacteria bacterium]|nr:hypothetical protein [Candidatus Saccharibacteria bacterium]
MTTKKYGDELHTHYPELFDSAELLREEDIATVTAVYGELSESDTITRETNSAVIRLEHVIRAMLWRGEASSTDTLVVPRHFGGGISPDATEFAHTLRALIPNAHVLVLPNDTVSRQAKADKPAFSGQNNLALSELDITKLAKGSVEPLAHRLSTLLHDQSLDDTTLHFVGTSQGALVSNGLATHMRDETKWQIGSLTLVDPPTILDPIRAGINAINLKRSMNHYESNLRIGGLGHHLTPDDELLFRKGAKAPPTEDYIHRATAFNDFMLHHRDNGIQSPDFVGVTARGQQSHISDGNLYQATPSRPYIEFRGDYADHSVAMLPILVAALARDSIVRYRRTASHHDQALKNSMAVATLQ